MAALPFWQYPAPMKGTTTAAATAAAEPNGKKRKVKTDLIRHYDKAREGNEKKEKGDSKQEEQRLGHDFKRWRDARYTVITTTSN